MTQNELADLSGVAQVTIARLESKRTRQQAHFSTLKKLARALDVTPAELVAPSEVATTN